VKGGRGPGIHAGVPQGQREDSTVGCAWAPGAAPGSEGIDMDEDLMELVWLGVVFAAMVAYGVLLR